MDDAAYQALLSRAKTLLGAEASPAARALIEQRLERLSSEFFLEWLVGDKRPRNEGEQLEHWLSRCYEELFADEQPDAMLIYQRFTIGLPRAGFLARMLRAGRASAWRSAARAELHGRLKWWEGDARKLQGGNDGRSNLRSFDVHLSAGAADELRLFYDRVAARPNQAIPPEPKTRSTYGRLRLVAVIADTLLLVLAMMEADERQ